MFVEFVAGRTRDIMRPAFFSRYAGHRRLICKFFRPPSAGSFLLRSLVHDANQSTRGIFHRFQFPPVLSSAPLLHNEQHAAKGLLNDTKSGARPGKSTARDGNYAC